MGSQDVASTNNWSNAFQPVTGDYLVQLDYDRNGNITHLKRNKQGGLMDDMSYQYVSPRPSHLPRKEFGPDLCVMEKEMQIPRSESIARSRRSAREMFPLIEQWLDQGGSQKDFCAFHRLPLAVFSYWLKKYRSREQEALDSGEQKFAALSIRDSASSGPVVEFPDGVKVRLAGGVSAAYLRELAGQC